MTNPDARSKALRSMAVLLLTTAASAVFIGMIWQFLIALFLAAVFSGLAYPLYSWLLERLHGRKNSAATATLAVIVIIVLLPTLLLLDLVGLQAVQLSEELVPWLQEQVQKPDLPYLKPPDWLPFHGRIDAVRPQITQKFGELASSIGGLLITGLSAATKGTAGFFLDLFVMLYAMLFFLKEGIDEVTTPDGTLQRDDILCFPSGRELNVVSRPGFKGYSLSISTALLDEVAASCGLQVGASIGAVQQPFQGGPIGGLT